MEADRDGSRKSQFRGAAQGWCAVLAACACLHLEEASAAGPRRHFDLQPGDAAVMLNEFSRQSDLQVLFDFNILKGMKTRGVHGELDASDALTSMLAGTNLVFDFVNERTLAVTAERKKPSALRRLWRRIASHPAGAAPRDELEQVLISGVPQSGTQPLLGAQTIQLSRLDIDRSGLATAQDFLRTLPQVFGGGPSEDTLLIGREANTNSARGAGVNVRGLDAGATLVLIDGRRMAPSGTEGTFEDISNIPLSAVDHIELLPDGTSARYGADAVAGVVNFVMRSDFSGAQTQARAAGVTDGSMAEHQLSQLFGANLDGGKAILAFEYYQRDALRAADRRQQTSDLTGFGGDNFNTPYGNPGTLTNGISFWPLPQVAGGATLSAASLTPGSPNLYDQDRGADITPAEQRWSLFGKANTDSGDGLNLFGDVLFTHRSVTNIAAAANPLIVSVPGTNPFYINPAGGSAPVTVLEGSATYFGVPQTRIQVSTGNFALGATLAAAYGWTTTGFVAYTFETQHEVVQGLDDQTTLDAALADPDPATAFDPFADGSHTNPATLAAIRSAALFDLDSSLRTVSITGAGPLATLPGGELQLAAGAEYRDQTFDTRVIGATPSLDPATRSVLGRRIRATFGELRIPLVGVRNALQLAQHLELSLGIRHEDYTDIGGATVPKLGVLWSPTASLGLRGTWTRSFRPPNLPALAQQDSFSTLLRLPDPTSASGSTTALVRYGSNPDLQAQRARSWTLGVDFAPPRVPGLSLSLTYFNVRYQGRIDAAQISSDVLQRPDLAWLVTRNVTAAEIAAVCSHGTFTGPAAACVNSAAGAIIDERLNNIALLRTRGIDLLGRYGVQSAIGKFDLGLNGTYLLDYSQANTPVSPLISLLSTQNNPIDLRFRGTIAWGRRGWGASANVNYDNGYRDTISVPGRRVDSLTTLDLQLTYETAADAYGWLGATRVALSVENVLGSYPPFLNNHIGVGYDQENADLLGRFVSVDIRKRW